MDNYSRTTFDAMGDRCKTIERAFEHTLQCPSDSCLVMRLDGRAFHTFTRTGIKHPFDPALSAAMTATATAVLKEFNACLAYTQSDEITVVLFATRDREGLLHLPFGGHLQKLVTTAAAVATRAFGLAVQEFLPHKIASVATFDARAFVCTTAEAEENLVWRQTDAMRNAISNMYHSRSDMGPPRSKIAGFHFMRAALVAAGEDLTTLLSHRVQGTFLRRRERLCMLEPDILDKIPVDRRPTGPIVRHETVETGWPPLSTLANLSDVLWLDAHPIANSPSKDSPP